MNYLYLAVPVIAIAAALLFSKNVAKTKGVKKGLITHFACLIVVFSLCFIGAAMVSAAPENGIEPYADNTSSDTAAAQDNTASSGEGLKMIAAALAIGLSGIGAGFAIAAGAPAAIGATAENPEVFGKAMIFVVLGEAIALYGLVISALIIFH